MVENNIRERIKDALSKIIDSNKYVINVDIDLDISDEVERANHSFVRKKFKPVC